MTKPTSVHESDPFLTLIDVRIDALQDLRASYIAAKATGALGRPEDVAAAVAPPARSPVGRLAAPLPAPVVAAAAVPASTLPVTTVVAAPERRRRNQGIALAVRSHLPTMTGPQRAADIAERCGTADWQPQNSIRPSPASSIA
jgi:hypothetical protein